MVFTEKEMNDDLVEIDQILQGKNIPISGRPLAAISEFSKKHRIGLPVSDPVPGSPHEVDKNWYVTQYITKWYENRYGERLKTYLGPGRCVFLLRGNPWVFKYPLFWGRFRYTASRIKPVDYSQEKNTITTHNILDFIIDFPNGLRETLSNAELHQLFQVFGFGLKALMKLRDVKDNELTNSAKSDLKSSVSHIMSDKPEFGLAKWSSLQATEKFIKFSLAKSSKNFKRTHNLANLVKQFENKQKEIQLIADIGKIQCSPSVRYGEEAVTLEEAVGAFHATLKVISKLEL